uniref:RING-type E3 ubiquitin transferase n=1 Tax=Pelusios castaneus TaxID=367368 RepID=A0A8C8S4A2_9SAUR
WVTHRNSAPLGNLMELVKGLSGQAVPGPQGGRVCERHQEPLKLFCEEDQTPICVVCDRSRAHRAHTVVPIEEAAQEYRVGPVIPMAGVTGSACLQGESPWPVSDQPWTGARDLPVW